jgi:hypothetical protein
MAAPASLGLERKNPLPKGRYWVFRIGPKDIVAFDAWLAKYRKAKALRVVSSELDQGETTAEMTAFIVWEVLRPDEVVWEGPGLPDRSPPHVTSAEDVISAPKILEPAEQMAEAAAKVTRAGENLPTLLFFAAIVYLLMNRDNR